MDTIERASTKARVIFAAVAVLMFAAIIFSKRFFDWVGDWISEDPNQTLDRFDVFVVWIAVFSLPLLVGGVLTYKNGSSSVSSARFPPSGMWVIVDTQVETGSRAKFRGRLLQLGGALMCATAIGFPFALWYIVHSVVDAA